MIVAIGQGAFEGKKYLALFYGSRIDAETDLGGKMVR
jgi:hypothetical protein